MALVLLASTEAGASSMPQLNPHWFSNQLLWLAVSFLVLYAGVSLVIYPAIKSVLDTRDAAINDAIREAELAKREADSTRGGAESAQHDARVRAADMLAKAHAEISAEATEQLAKLHGDLSRRATQAEHVVEAAVAKARAGIAPVAEELAREMVSHLLSGADGGAHESGAGLKLATSR